MATSNLERFNAFLSENAKQYDGDPANIKGWGLWINQNDKTLEFWAYNFGHQEVETRYVRLGSRELQDFKDYPYRKILDDLFKEVNKGIARLTGEKDDKAREDLS